MIPQAHSVGWGFHNHVTITVALGVTFLTHLVQTAVDTQNGGHIAERQ